MLKVKKIWFNGNLVPSDKAKVHVLTHALHYGTGIFEGIRCYRTGNGGSVFRLDDHVKRFFNSAGYLGIKIPFSREQIKKAILATIKSNGLTECYIRPVAFSGYDRIDLDVAGSKVDVAIIAWPWGALYGHRNLSVAIAKHRRLSPKAVPMEAKISGYYVNSIIASAEAKKKGADEAILLDEEGYVAEGAGENVFMVKNSKLFTPSLGSILPGITRDSVIKIAKDLEIRTIEKKIKPGELKNAEEIFFTGTAVEVTPIVKLDSRKIGLGIPGPVTMKISSEYGKIVRGQVGKYKKWLVSC